jgi:hypothetical protein
MEQLTVSDRLLLIGGHLPTWNRNRPLNSSLQIKVGVSIVIDTTELWPDSPEVDTTSRLSQIAPTFEIINGEEKRYPCDPTAAVDGAHLDILTRSIGASIRFIFVAKNSRTDCDRCHI